MKHYQNKWYSFAFAILNTYDPFYRESERLSSPKQLHVLLQKHELFCDEVPTQEDVKTVCAYRDELRYLIINGSNINLVDFLNEYEERSSIRSRIYLGEKNNFELINEQPSNKNILLSDRILAVCSFALGRELVKHGRDRLKLCDSYPCEEIFMDHSKNKLQRFCSKRCSTRYHVKKHRKSNNN